MNPAAETILNTKEPFRSILLQLQVIIEQAVPEAVLLFKWGIPYYYLDGKKPLVYLHTTKHYVDLGFAQGFLLKNHQDKLVSENRNTVKSLRYYTVNDLEFDVLIDLLEEAKTLITS